MEVDELRRLIEAQGYEVKAIRVFKKSFHVNFWSPKCKMKVYYKLPLSEVTWNMIKQDYPKFGCRKVGRVKPNEV